MAHMLGSANSSGTRKTCTALSRLHSRRSGVNASEQTRTKAVSMSVAPILNDGSIANCAPSLLHQAAAGKTRLLRTRRVCSFSHAHRDAARTGGRARAAPGRYGASFVGDWPRTSVQVERRTRIEPAMRAISGLRSMLDDRIIRQGDLRPAQTFLDQLPGGAARSKRGAAIAPSARPGDQR